MFVYKEIMAELTDYNHIRLLKPIVLIGMMGSGKTHMGRVFAKKLNQPFFDSDKLIEEKAGCSIADIFERFGEQKFRTVEANTIQDLIKQGHGVIATGGGAIMNEDTARMIFDKSYSVWVQADLDKIISRVSKNKNRPLLACENPKDVLKKLMEQRQPIYEKARFRMQSDSGDETESVTNTLSDIRAVAAQEAKQ